MSKRGSYVYGVHPVGELLRSRPEDVHRVYFVQTAKSGRFFEIERAAHKHKIQVVGLSRTQLEDLVGSVNHQGIAAAVESFRYAELEDVLSQHAGAAPLLVALDQIQDPHNLGAIIRSAFALGAQGVVIPKDRACEITPTVVKASAGATSHLPVIRVTNLNRALHDMREAGLWIYGLAAEGDRNLYDEELVGPTVLVVGSEGQGLRRMIAESCDRLLRIPMLGELGSLNASVAAGVALYEAARQRNLRQSK